MLRNPGNLEAMRFRGVSKIRLPVSKPENEKNQNNDAPKKLLTNALPKHSIPDLGSISDHNVVASYYRRHVLLFSRGCLGEGEEVTTRTYSAHQMRAELMAKSPTLQGLPSPQENSPPRFHCNPPKKNVPPQRTQNLEVSLFPLKKHNFARPNTQFPATYHLEKIHTHKNRRIDTKNASPPKIG